MENIKYVIEDNVPIPERTSQTATRKPRNTMPLDQMEVGQSFVVPFKDGEDIEKGRKRVTATVSQTRKRKLGKGSSVKFIVGTVENGYRVWRKA
ncbi:hypothetical protein FW755_00710 [Lonepinella koalarum]|uniref:DUF7303 family protein n=1 Tax=Lonepinella koalarum TaxID=53417 RepID=UPI0011E4B719|nr:hypothetical protein [Lonepinella koalarum]TYG33717.1 hypothetical protein FW755_00710 [Lonepinella koalarum]